MRTVFSNSEVCHVFARNSQDYGRGPSIFFEPYESHGHYVHLNTEKEKWIPGHRVASVLYSYGHHFPICSILNNGALLFTTSSCSVTTSKHIGYAQHAVSHYERRAYVPVPVPGRGKENAEKVLEGVRFIIGKAARARSRRLFLLNDCRDMLENLRLYFELTGERLPADIRKRIETAESFVNDATGPKRYYFELAKLRAAEQKKAERKEKENRRKWYRFEFSGGVVGPNGETLLRYNRETEQVETSKGVRISRRAAAVLFRLWDAGKAYGAHIEGWTVSQSGPEGITAGCHTITADEIRRCAADMKLSEAEGNEETVETPEVLS